MLASLFSHFNYIDIINVFILVKLLSRSVSNLSLDVIFTTVYLNNFSYGVKYYLQVAYFNTTLFFSKATPSRTIQ